MVDEPPNPGVVRGLARQLSQGVLQDQTVALARNVPPGVWSILFIFGVWLPASTAVFWSVEGWCMWNSFVFAGALCTTVGYGNLTPVTDEGKLLAVVCALVGIPCVLLGIAFLGQVYLLLVDMALLRCLRRPVQPRERNVVLALTCAAYYVQCILTYMFMERWSFVDSLYYTFICFSTIGLGDLVPLSAPEDMSPITFYHFWHLVMVTFGLVFLAAAVALMMERVEAVNRGLSEKASAMVPAHFSLQGEARGEDTGTKLGTILEDSKCDETLGAASFSVHDCVATST